MPTLPLVDEHCQLSSDERTFLVELIMGWNLLADLSFSDLILWVPDSDDNIFWAVHQVRPSTGPTALEEDVVGECVAYDPESLVVEAYLSEEICETSNNQLRAGIPVDVHAIPVIRKGRCLAVVEQHTNRMGVRAPGALEDAYLEAAACLTDMLRTGDFPLRPHDVHPTNNPRVGDGLVRVQANGLVSYASPNAVTAFRRLGLVGDLLGEHFLSVVRNLTPSTGDPSDETIGWVPSGSCRPVLMELNGPRASIRARVQPLRREGRDAGSVVLCRDTTELQHRERQLVTKDATIREIHHRVKNNLQTVASLLRMQARRIQVPEAKAALGDAMERVSAIALVHEVLSQSFEDAVEFDTVCDRILEMAGSLSATTGTVHALRSGSFGMIGGSVCTNLALVLTELFGNAVEHGLGQSDGTIEVRPTRMPVGPGRDILDLIVIDDGSGLPDAFDLDTNRSLGLSIVSTLVADLGGIFQLTNNPDSRGTTARVQIPLEKVQT